MFIFVLSHFTAYTRLFASFDEEVKANEAELEQGRV